MKSTTTKSEGAQGGAQLGAMVVGVDRQLSSAAALRFAMGLAGPLRTHLYVLHITDIDDYPIDPDGPGYEEAADLALRAESAQARRMLKDSPVSWTYSADRGNPAELLLRKADEVDALMIVIGASRGGIVAALERLGRVAKQFSGADRSRLFGVA